MSDNFLRPKPYDSLENIALRKNAPARMPKKIHQVWFSNQEIRPVRMRLHHTFKEVNPEYEVNLWTPKNITEETFPLTYNLISAGLEYEKFDDIVSKTAFADFARVEVLYQQGGFYFDFKFEALRPLDPFRKYEILFNECDYTHKYKAINYFGASAGA